MPGEFSDAGSAKALDAVTGRATVNSATTYLALLTSAPNDTTTLSTMAEYDATGYERKSVTWTTPALNASDVPESENAATVTFGPFTGGTGATVSHCALVDAASGTTGAILAYWELDTARTPAANDSVEIVGGNIKISVD